MNRKRVLLSATALTLGAVAADAQSKSPNIIYILADDLGYGDLSCYGQEKFQTPNIDRMAKGGMQFTQHYAGCTVSAPSRCSFMTGKHTGHCYIRGNHSTKNADGRVYDTALPQDEVTIAELLKQKGYSTACIGKWGMGGPNTEGHPNNQGFDYFYGYLGQLHAHWFYPQFLHENENLVELNGKHYSHDLLEEKALQYIKENQENPFFMYLTFTLPHAELILPDKYRAKYEGKFEEKEYIGNHYGSQKYTHAAFAAMVDRLDVSVGRVNELLKELGLDENTLVIFTSDNGAHAEGGADPKFFNSTAGLRGIKRDLYEGGIRVPMIAYWPETVPAGEKSNTMSAFWDMMPTFCELAKVKAPKSADGISIVPTLKGKKQRKQHDHLYWEFHEMGGRQAVRQGDWKLIRLQAKNEKKTFYELYNIVEDPFEKKNVIAEYPELVKEMTMIMDNSRTQNPIFKM